MVFSSMLFVFLFLPVFLLFHCLSKSIRSKNRVLLIFSLIFFLWGGLKCLILVVVLSFVTYYLARLIDLSDTPKQRKITLIANIAILVGILFFYKYILSFIVSFNIPAADDTFTKVAIPLGLSFYTFKLISYVVDVYKGIVKSAKNFELFLTYSSMFHHCVAGPIVRYKTIEHEMTSRKRIPSQIAYGAFRCSVGLAKKTILADHCGTLATQLLPMSENIINAPVSAVWLGSFLYMLQIYLDFSAYSDIAIGLGEILGFHFGENFNYPYTAVSVKDFWRRWHISLSSFFKDYVYIPLGGNRVSPKRLIFNLAVVWALTGIWHGSTLNYFIWGMYFFAFIVLENFLGKHSFFNIPKVLWRIVTLFIIFISWIIFRFENIEYLGSALAGLFGGNGNPLSNSVTDITLLNNIFIVAVAVLACTPLLNNLYNKATKWTLIQRNFQKKMYIIRIIISIVLIVISVFAMIGNSYTPFLYYQF